MRSVLLGDCSHPLASVSVENIRKWEHQMKWWIKLWRKLLWGWLGDNPTVTMKPGRHHHWHNRHPLISQSFGIKRLSYFTWAYLDTMRRYWQHFVAKITLLNWATGQKEFSSGTHPTHRRVLWQTAKIKIKNRRQLSLLPILQLQ